MKSIGLKFVCLVSALAVAFFTFVFVQTWATSRRYMEDITANTAELAIHFDLAIRDYVADKIRPALEKRLGDEEFLVEAMSTSYVARNVFERVRKEYPDYVLKFSADAPRNPANKAGPEEEALLKKFRDEPALSRWVGRLPMGGRDYWAYCVPRRMKRECLHCHGKPEDAPPALLAAYGSAAGFHWDVGEVIAADVVAIPMAKVDGMLAAQAKQQIVILGIGMAILFGTILMAFRLLVGRRLAAMARCLQAAAQRDGDLAMAPMPVKGDDEIGVVAASFNGLLCRFRGLYDSLDQLVAQRTFELESRITQQRKIEDALRNSEARLRGMFERGPLGIVTSTPDRVIMEANEAFCRIVGYTADELRGRTAESISHPDDSQRSSQGIAELLQGKCSSHTIEKRFMRRDGAIVWGRVTCTAVCDSVGQPDYLLAMIEDVTESKLAEEALRDSEHRYRLLAQNVKDAIWTCDMDFRWSYFSPSTELLTGFTAEEQSRRSLAEILTPSSARLVAETLRQRLRAAAVDPSLVHVPVSLEAEHYRKDGSTVWVEVNASFILSDGGHPIGIVGVSRDISARKAIQDQLAKARDAAEAASRAKSEFLANMSHEIRTPMTAILGFADMLLESPAHEDALEFMHVIKRNGEHLLRIINDILDLSKIEAGKQRVELTVCSPRQLLADIIAMMKVRAEGKGLVMALAYADDVPGWIKTDPLRVRQILVNLIGNAIKFTEVGGVNVSVRPATDSTGQPMLRFDVSDTGIGLSDEQIASLFQPFSQADASTNRRFGGTGLGLVISSRLAHMLGGDIAVSSEAGKGSTFSLIIAAGASIPHMQAGEPTASESAILSPAPPCKRFHGRILLAEDGTDNQRLIGLILRKAGAELTIVENGQRAVDCALSAEASGSSFAVIVMDMQMPVMDGYTATRRLRSAGYTGPILALTAHAMTEDRQRCLDAGCDAYLSKPVDREKLLTAVVELRGCADSVNQPCESAFSRQTVSGD